ncbi:DUF3558 domain-containing protein [Pseudonocardia sp. MH-G8]|uniref:DUF3558 domain-containing protein n=1 Tax=Pseudonocardia sp. MH-G8 TaxID=1854588 RepID=UPI00130466D1|nr:DUF3558 domain-containing protein [Pseudonocardia sp. MH-G8]
MVLAVVLAVLTSACAVGGSPSPPSAPEGSPGGGIELPARPREVRLDGVDPCSLLTEQQRVELGLDGRPVSTRDRVGLYEGTEVPLCTVRGFEPRAVTVGVSLVGSVGIERFTSGELATDLQQVTVQGFPAVVAVPTRFTDYCTVIVDVAAGQLLDVQYGTGGQQPPIPQMQLCRDAETVAGAAMMTLLNS